MPFGKPPETVPFSFGKRAWLFASLVALVTAGFDSSAYADLFVCNDAHNNILRYDERTGDFLGEFIPSGSGGLFSPRGLIFGPDGNLYVSSGGSRFIFRYDGITGEPLPSPGSTGAIFVGPSSGGPTREFSAWLIFGPDGNLYVTSGGITAPPASSSVLRFNGTTGEFIDAFVSPGSGGLTGPRGLVFGPDGHLYVNCNQPGPGSVLRYDGQTGAFLDIFVPAGSNPFGESGPGNPRGLVFGPDGNLYVSNFPVLHPSVLRYDGKTGALIDAFVSEGSGGLQYLTGPLFGPNGNLYLRSSPSDPGAVLRYDGTTGMFMDDFVPYGSGGLMDNANFAFRNTDPTTLAYVPVRRLHITAASTAVTGTPFDIMVTALDPNGNIDTNYQGTVTFSTTDPDSGVMLPADYTFTIGDGGDKGTHTFTGEVTLATAGNYTLTATDTVSGIIGRVTITVDP
jgi:streptogramin lyase